MFVYSTILCNALSLLILTVDVTAFFMFVSAVMLMRHITWLLPFQQAGGALVRGYTGLVDRWWTRFHRRSLSLRGKHVIGLFILEAIRLILVGIASIL